MIHLVTAVHRHLYGRELLELHRLRCRHFIEERRWALEAREGGEYDAYDDERAAYLIGFSPEREIEVACRIRPTDGGGVLPDLFPHLVSPTEPPADAPGMFECTRYFAVERARGRAGFVARSRLHVAMVEHVRDLAGCRLLGFVDLPLLTHLRRFSGLRIRPVGFPATYDGGHNRLRDRRHRRGLGRHVRAPAVAAPAAVRRLAWLPCGVDVFDLERSVRLLLAAPEVHRAALDGRAADGLEPADPDGVWQALARAA